jgi:hypothetical protein
MVAPSSVPLIADSRFCFSEKPRERGEDGGETQRVDDHEQRHECVEYELHRARLYLTTKNLCRG